MSDNKQMYVSIHNFYPGRENIPAGTVFSVDQWEACGGESTGLADHIKKGNITKWAGQEAPVGAAPVLAPAPEIVEPEPEPEIVEPEPEATKPEGVWAFTREELEPLSLDALNTFYKDHAAKYGLSVRAYKDKEALIVKMISEAAPKKDEE